MSEYRKIDGEVLSEERSLYASAFVQVTDCVFRGDGESPLKESHDLIIENTTFQWKYPLWYCRNVQMKGSTCFEMARAGMWYTDHMQVEDCLIEAPKSFRKCYDLSFRSTSFTKAEETLWNCEGVKLDTVTAKGDYFCMGSSDLYIDHLNLIGNYCFDGVKNVEVHNARMIGRDCFWNSENVTVYDSYISGAYLAWNSKNITFINCTIESLQGLCYMDNLVMKNCRLINTELAFEYSTVDADLRGHVVSIVNPKSGRIAVDTVGEIILEPERIDPTATEILVRSKEQPGEQ